MAEVPRRERFFKYMSASTARIVLERSTVRYSSPLIFNDPFDVQSGLHFEFDIDSFPKRTLLRIRDLVTASARPEVAEEDEMGKIIILMWENKEDNSKREFAESFLLLPLLEALRDRIAHYQAQCQALWGDDFLPRLRVFSITEEPANLLMWSHYAQNHTGAVLAFRVLAKEDNALCVAKPVIYRGVPPPLFSEEEWLGLLLGTKSLDPNEKLFLHYAYFKSDIWAYEKEWRVWLLEPQPQQELFTDYQLLPEEVEAVYLGCKMDPKDKEAIKILLSAKYPEAQIFQGRKPVSEYRLHFDNV